MIGRTQRISVLYLFVSLKAFYNEDHSLLLGCLQAITSENNAIKLTDGYILDRHQCVALVNRDLILAHKYI